MTAYPFISFDEEEAFREAKNFGLFFNLSLDTATDGDLSVRLWTGVGDYPVRPETTDTPFTGFESVDLEGDVYKGMGVLQEQALSELEVLLNGVSEQVKFSLNSVPADIANKIDEAAPIVKGRPVRLGLAPLDDLWQPVTPIQQMWSGIADYWAMQMDPVTREDDAAVRSIILTVSSGFTSRSRPRLVSYTDAQQQLYYPGDLIFNRVTRYVTSYTIAWPSF